MFSYSHQPLSAFTSGLEVIHSSVGALSVDIAVVCPTPEAGYQKIERVNSRVATISDSLNDMSNINSFMLMTINRCIDYTKG